MLPVGGLATRGHASAAAVTAPPLHVTTIADLSQAQIASVLQLAHKMKAAPEEYHDALRRRTLLMLFEKPSLRTRVSLETGMTQMGGHAISYMIGDSPLGVKESISDAAKVLSRYCDAVSARVNSRDSVMGLANNSSIPIINALDDFAHPMQMLADMQTMEEKHGSLKGVTLAFVGDIQNNVTYDLMRSACIMGFDMRVAGPAGGDYDVDPAVLAHCAELSAVGGGSASVVGSAAEAVCGANVVYADSWMSYGISAEQQEARMASLMPFQVTEALMDTAAPDAIFMNCLPAMREFEQTAEVIDGPRSVVFDQAENRLHAQKALLYLLVTRQL